MMLRVAAMVSALVAVAAVLYGIYLVQRDKPVCPRCKCQYIELEGGRKRWHCRVCGFEFTLTL